MSAAPRRGAAAWLVPNLLLALGYVALAWPAQRVFPHVATFWPPTALAVLAAMLGGWRAMPGIALGSLLVNLLLFHWSAPLSAAVALGNCAGPLLGRAGMRRGELERDTLWAHPLAVAAFLFWMGPVQASVAAVCGIGALYASAALAPGAALPLTLGWAIDEPGWVNGSGKLLTRVSAKRNDAEVSNRTTTIMSRFMAFPPRKQ